MSDDPRSGDPLGRFHVSLKSVPQRSNLVSSLGQLKRRSQAREGRFVETMLDTVGELVVALDQENRFATAVLDIVGALIVVLDREGRIVRFNRTCEQTTGYTSDEVKGRHIWDLLLTPDEVEPVQTVFMRLCAGDFPLDFENHWATKAGRLRLIAWSNTALMDKDGAVEYVIGTGIDVTERRQAEREVRHMSSFPQLNPNPVLEVDAAGEIIFCNASALRILEQIGCEPDPRLFLPPDMPAIMHTLQQPPATVVQREVRIANAYFAESLHRAPGFDTVRIFTIDITQRKQAEEQLRYQAFLLENIFDAIIATDLDFHILNWNKAAEELYGWEAGEILGKRANDVLQSDLTVPRAEIIRQLYVTGRWKGEVVHQCKDGHKVHVLASTRLLHAADGTPIGIVSANRDITDRKQAEFALWRSEERYALAQRAAKIGSWDWDIPSGQLYWSDRLEPLFGFLPGEFGGTYEAFLACVHPDDRQTVVDAVTVSIETGKDYSIEHRVVWPNGEVHWIAETGDVFRDAQGQATRMLGVARDVTEQRRTLDLLHAYNAELEARNAELDAYAQTVAHDIKNPLHLVLSAAELLHEVYGGQLPEDALAPLQIVLKGGRKINSITEELLLLSDVRRAEVASQPLDMALIVSEARQRLAAAVDAEVEIRLPEVWPTALGYAPWVEEVWSNYLHNALKYGGRPLCIELGSTIESKEYVRYWVRDNGVGISTDRQATLFNSFDRAVYPRRSGHGLGLSIVKRIVEKLGGEIGVQSSGVPGEGSIFSFTLPAAHTGGDIDVPQH